MLDPLILLALAGVGLIAGFVDAVAGGGGLLALPALLSTGMPPIAALATNKLQGSIGTGVAALTYWRRGFVDLPKFGPAIALALAGSFLGAWAVKSIDTSALNTIVPVALIVVAGYFLLVPRLTDQNRAARLAIPLFAPLIGFAIGFYDGIFGPGTGSFFTICFVALFGLGITRAAAHTKVLNFASNIAALALFIPAGDVVWAAALAMGVGQVTGGYLGAVTGIRFGAKFIKPLVVVVSVIMAARLLFSG